MIKKVIFIIITLQLALFAELQSIDAKEMLKLHKNGAPIIDIRTAPEWKETGVVPDSNKLTFFDENGGYDIDKFMSEFKKLVKDTNQTFILVCRSANRTKTLGHFLADQLGYKNAKDLDGGIKKWISDGREVVK